MSQTPRFLCLLAATSALAACQSIGPATIARDRLDYSGSIAESWKHQMLMNVVKLRYGDTPVFVDVGQVVGGYTLETSVSLGISREGVAGSGETYGGSGRFTDRPTITYVPLTGPRFVSGLVTPLAPASLLSGIQAGWPSDTLLPMGVASINGIRNEEYSNSEYRLPDPRFERIVDRHSKPAPVDAL